MRYRVLVSVLDDGTHLEVWELCALDDENVVRPGFDRAATTFMWVPAEAP